MTQGKSAHLRAIRRPSVERAVEEYKPAVAFCDSSHCSQDLECPKQI